MGIFDKLREKKKRQKTSDLESPRVSKDIAPKAKNFYKSEKKAAYLPKDAKEIDKLAKEGEQYLEKLKEVDERLISIQNSTKTFIPKINPVHNYFRMKSKWYYNWHLNPHCSKLHWGILTTYLLLLFVSIMIGSFGGPYKPAKAAYTCTSSGLGGEMNWLDSTTWNDCDGSPGPGDSVVIAGGDYVYAESGATIASLKVNDGGELSLYGMPMIVSGDVTIDFIMDASYATLEVGGNFSMPNGSLTGYYSSTNFEGSTVEFTSSTSGKTIDFGGVAPNDLTFSGTGGWSLSRDTPVTNNFSITSSGTVLTKGYELDINGNISITGILDTTDDVETDGTIITDAGNFTINPGGTFVKDVTGTRSLVKMDGGATKTLTSDGEDLGDFQTSTASTHIDLQDTLTIQNFIIDAFTTLHANNQNMTVAGDWLNFGTFTAGTGTVNFTKSATQTLNSGGVAVANTFYNLTHSGAGTLQLLTNNINIDGDFTNSNGTFDANGKNINVAKNWGVSGGSFSAGTTPDTQTVTFDSVDASIISGSTTFNNLTFDSSAGEKIVKVTAGTTQTISSGKILSLSGVDDTKRITYQSTTDGGLAGDRYTFAIPSNISNVNYANVRDFNVSGGTITPVTSTCTDTGNNNGWLFNQAPNSPTALAQKKTDTTPIAVGGWINETSVVFSGSLSDPDDADQVKLQVEVQLLGTTFTDSPSGTSTSYCEDPCINNVTITSPILSNGSQYHWQAKTIDDSGDTSGWGSYGGNGEGERDFGVDTTAPTGDSISIDSDATYTNSIGATLTLTASDTGGSGLYQMAFSNDGSAYSDWENYNTTKSWNLTNGEGVKTVYAKFKDNANNESNPISDTITLDTIAPTGSISIASGQLYTDTTSVDLTLSASDIGGSGVYQMRLSNNGTDWLAFEAYSTSKSWDLTSEDGTKTVYVQYKDNATNTSSIYSDSIIYDGTPPGTTTPSATSPTNDTTPTWSWEAAVDTGGSEIEGYYVKIGTTSGGSQILSETSIGDVLNYTPTVLSQGTYYLSVKAKDNAGNSGNYTSSSALILDTTAPSGSVIINAGAAATASTSVNLTLSATDTGGAELSKMRFSNDNLTYSSWEDYGVGKTWILSDGDGTKSVYVQYNDTVGNVSTAYSDVIILDVTGPGDFSLYSPAANSWVNSTSVTFQWENASSLSGLTKYQLYIDDALSLDNISSSATSASVSGLSISSHTWYVKAFDNLGHTKSTTTRQFNIDLIPPTKVNNLVVNNLTNKDLNLTNNQTIELRWDAATDAGGAGVRSYLVYFGTSDSSADVVNGEETANTTFSRSLSRNGTYYVWVKARGTAGNIGESSSICSFRLDTEAPSRPGGLKVFDVSNRIAGVYETFIDFAASTDGLSGLKEYEIYRDGQKVGTTSDNYYVDQKLQEKTYSYQVKAYDNAGNVSGSDKVSVELVSKSSLKPNISDVRAIPSKVVSKDNKTTAIISWKTDRPTTSLVFYGLGGAKANQTDLDSKLNTGHTVILPDLKSSTTYHYSVMSKDIYGNQIESGDMTFTTVASLKQESVLDIILKTLQKSFEWIKKVIAAPVLDKLGLVKSPLQLSSSMAAFDVSSPEAKKYQVFVAVANKNTFSLQRSTDGKSFRDIANVTGKDYFIDRDLQNNQTYYYRVSGIDGTVSVHPAGIDSTPPLISDIKSKTLSIAKDKIEVLVSWQTDKLSKGEIEIEGKTIDLDGLNQTHTTTLSDLKPSQTYKYKVSSAVEEGGSSSSGEQTITTPGVPDEKSILQLILNTLQKALGSVARWFQT
ncbi:MAG: fibronectin type III domain-containing protein [Candidatus Berkelbacteria bacterium]|nr:fibronectin type III domain-containing protein [Candidatus Berkelbacteria bacterium]